MSKKAHYREFRKYREGQPRWRSGLALPAAQGVILETLDRVPLSGSLYLSLIHI